jgi:Rrf2 family cysteine metabolism transcriptional repressor
VLLQGERVRISAKAEYACLAVIALAERHREDRPLRIREIAGAQKIPATFLMQILLKLKRGGLVKSTRGSSGGYRLARPPDEISLIDVLRIVDGHDLTAPERNSPSAPVLAGVWGQIRNFETTILSTTSIAKLLEASNSHVWVI